MSKVEILIQNGSTIYAPAVESGATWETARRGEPGKLIFSIVDNFPLNITEGDAVRVSVDGKNIFYGFIFSLKRDKGETLKVTAYDQLRYLKNKDTYIYKNKTAGDVVSMLAADFGLQTGEIENTGFVIPARVEDNKTLFDIIQNALDLTMQNAVKLYVLYDDFGKLTLKNIENMKLNSLIDETAGENFDYTSSIDGETYNKIKLTYENEEAGTRDVYIAQDSGNMNKWGVLQYFDTIEEGVNGKAKADSLLSLYNRKTKTLSIKNVFGDIRVRAGSSLPVILDLGDTKVQNYMIVEKVKHSFINSLHTMDLTLRGGEFIA